MNHGTPEQRKARYHVKEALKHGRMMRGVRCEKCGTPNRPASEGRSVLHAHHHDYSKPLEIEWLCAKCHRSETRIATGERNGNAVLTRGLVVAARLLRREGWCIADIATFYRVSRAGLSHAINGRTWSTAERAKAVR